MSEIRIQQGDCLELMSHLPTASIDLVLADLPYGVTDCHWDKRIPMAPLWKQYERVLNERGVVALFAQQPFATDLINGARRMFRYEWIWDKGAATGFANSHRMPMRRHENVLVFYTRLPEYHPQGLKPCRARIHAGNTSEPYGRIRGEAFAQQFTGYPQSIVQFRRTPGAAACQKPVELLEYLIRTYTAEGATVLDNVMGTGSTAVAAVNSGRAFIGFEIDPERFRTAERRIHEALSMVTSVSPSIAANPLQIRCRHAKPETAGGRGVRKAARPAADGHRRARKNAAVTKHSGLVASARSGGEKTYQ